MQLDTYRNQDYDIGASYFTQVLWHLVGTLFVSNQFLPGSNWRRIILRCFGANIGRDVVIKPGVKIKFPWKLVVGDFCWIGERVWIDNLACVSIGEHTCISQSAYLCCGSHDYSKSSFDLITKPIQVGKQVWICAAAYVGPGSILEDGAVLTLGSVATGTLGSWSIYQGNPAIKVKDRPPQK